MTHSITNMTRADWEAKYKPLPNHLNKHAADNLFETHGRELKFVQTAPFNKVWTLVDGADEGDTYISNGIHFVNRMGYYVTEVPFEENEIIQVF